MLPRIILAAALSFGAVTAHAQAHVQNSVEIGPVQTTVQMAEDYDSAVFILTLPPEVRAEMGHRIGIIGAGGILTLMSF